MAKRLKVAPVTEELDDRFLAVEDVMNLLSCSASHVYMLEKTNNIDVITIACDAGKAGPNTKRISLNSVRRFVSSRRQKQPENDKA